jgi:hypothetical protein
MLRPSKHSHPDQTVIAVAVHVLQRMRKKRIIGYDALRDFIRKSVKGGDALFIPSLSFLFLVGLIAYHPKTDTFEYVGPNAVV